MGFIIPKANTHPDVAKNQHLVPRTYMKKWSYNGSDTVYVFDKSKKEKGVHPRSIEKINYKVGFHDIKAGDVFVPDEALDDIFGCLSEYTIEMNGVLLKTLRELNDNFNHFEEWTIVDANGCRATKKECNEVKRVIEQSRYTFIETEWCKQYENDWASYIDRLENKIRSAVYRVKSKLTMEERIKLMEYILIYDFRNVNGNAWINNIIDDVIPEELSEVEVPNQERVHHFNRTCGDEIKYEVRIRAFYEYLKNRTGKMQLLGIKICLTSRENPFITSENPSMVVKNKKGQYEHIFVATPTMLITTFKTDNVRNYYTDTLYRKEVREYNKYIAQNANILITLDNSYCFEKILPKA